MHAVGNMARKMRKLILPFAVSAENRQKSFTREMEKAAVFCLAEIERKKAGGILKKEPGEELHFIARFCYPMWLVPWNGRSLLFDGFSMFTHKLHYKTLPDVKVFINDIRVSAETREAYSAFLSDRLNFFKNFIGEEERDIEGLATSPELLQDFLTYLEEAKTTREPLVDEALLSPAFDESTLLSVVHDLSSLRSTMKDEIENLRGAMKLLSTTTKKQVKAIHERIKETQKEFDEKIKTLDSSLAEQASRIRKKYDQEITKRTKEIERKLHRVHRNRVKLEKNMQSANAKMERCETEIRSSRLHKDQTSELRWREELGICRKRLSALERSIKDIDRKIEDTTAAKKREIAKLRSECDEKVEEAMKGVRDMEAARDAKIRMSEQEIESLEDSTKTIVDQIDYLVGMKRAALDELDGMGVSKRINRYALVYLPFYLFCYQEKLKNRYVLYPPSVAGSIGLLTKFKGVFGGTKVKSLLQPSSKVITTLLNELLPLIEQNPVFEKEMVDAGIKANILRGNDSRKKLRRGLEELEEEGWISESEFQALSKFLV